MSYQEKLAAIQARLEEMKAREEPTKIPPCPVCGEELVIGSIGGGEPTQWHCQRVRALRGEEAQEHWRRSSFADRKHTNSDLSALVGWALEMVAEWRSALAQPGMWRARSAEAGIDSLGKALGIS